MKRILFIYTNWRICEKIINIPLELSKEYSVDILLLNKMSYSKRWPGKRDLRELMINNYLDSSDNIETIYDGGSAYIKDYKIFISDNDYIEPSKYDLVIYDDNRFSEGIGIPLIYKLFKNKDIPVVGNSHGNQNINYAVRDFALEKCFDYYMCFGEYDKQKLIDKKYDGSKIFTGGIPSNDIIKNFKDNNKKENVYIITNYLGNQPSLFNVNFNKDLVDKLEISDLSKLFGVPTKIKIKPRLEMDIEKDIIYLNTILSNVDIIIDDTNNEQLFNSKLVISSYSTLAFKSIQMGIPTLLIEGSGQEGSLDEFPYTDKDYKPNEEFLELDHDHSIFIEHRISGGSDFTSTEKYIKNIKKII